MCLSSKPAILHSKNFRDEHYVQTVLPILFIPAMLIGTIDFYNFRSLSVTLTSLGGHKISTKEKLLS